MRQSLTPAQFVAVRHRILFHGSIVAAPVATVINVYFALWQPVTHGSRLVDVGIDLLESVGFAVIILLISSQILKVWLAPHARWAVEGGEPDEDDRAALVYLPVRAALWILYSNTLITVVSFAVNLAINRKLVSAVGTSVSFFLVGFTFAVIVYLQTERALRPLFALALTESGVPRRRSVGIRPRLALAWTLGSALPFLFIIAIPLRSTSGDVLPLLVPMLFMAIGGLVLGGMTTALAARSVAEPVEGVRAGLERVRDGNLDGELEVTNPGDLGQLQAGFNEMVTGLRARRILEDLFGRHVGADVARQATELGVELGGEVRFVTALFVDIIGSTGFAESHPPRVVVSRVNELFQVVFDVVSAGGGWINKFEGDGCLCVFGAPADLADHPAHGLAAARTLAERLDSVGLEVGVGVSSGEVVAGNVGSVERFEYTVIGRPINEASRLTEAAKLVSSHVLAAAHTVAAAGAEGQYWVDGGQLDLRGLREPLAVATPRETAPVPD